MKFKRLRRISFLSFIFWDFPSLWQRELCSDIMITVASWNIVVLGIILGCFVKILSKDNKNRNAIFKEGGVDNFSHEIITSYCRKLVEL